MVKKVLSHHRRLDVLVNNSGMSVTIPHSSLKKASPEVWRNLYEVIAPWTLIAEAENALRQSSSRECPSCILNISSHAGIRPKGASIPYSTSKAALNHVTKLLALCKDFSAKSKLRCCSCLYAQGVERHLSYFNFLVGLFWLCCLCG
ncbi:SDR family NAD(P)-dependent oxidoreductase [Leptolyngbya sp. AN03gr2]|uniref:SDR family NAD(P)-dependent oxidoreductase n=1 Tax=unclassified Leptolyngbya TaxID=2650499 RepID=UPI003D310F0A